MKTRIFLSMFLFLISFVMFAQTNDRTDFWKQGLVYAPNSTAQTTGNIETRTGFWKQGLMYAPNSTAQTSNN